MNRHFLILPIVSVALASCDMGGSLSSGSFDPLDPAGGGGQTPPLVDGGYKPGEFVKTSMHNAAFFKERPKGDADADKLLSANTPMKVISSDGSYLKVELDSGEIGYIPAVMVIDQSGSATTDPYADGAVQVWPLPPSQLDSGLGPEDPAVPKIPTGIDPDAVDPIPLPPPLPDDAPTPGLGAEPPVSPSPSSPESSPEDDSEKAPQAP